MKIGLISTWAISDKAIGGTERFVIDLAQSLVQVGHEVDVYMFSGISHKQNGVNYININLFNIEGEADEYIVQEYFGRFEDYEAYSKLARKLESEIDVKKYDFIQLNSLLFLEAWKTKKRIFTIHTNPFEYKLAWGNKSYDKMLEIMSNYKDNELTKFVAPSIYYAEQYSKLTYCDVKFIPYAIDVKRIETSKSKQDIIDKYKLTNNKIKIIVPSRLEPIQKQPKMVLDACCLLNEEEKEKIEVIFTGLDKQYIKFVDELKEQACNNNVDIKIIRFDYMAEVYKIGDLTILPSKSESFGYSALESLSMGIYTILNDIPTFNEIALNNGFNYIFKNNIIELKEKISEIINNKKYQKRVMPKHSWQEQYTLENFEKSYINLFV